jgi:hypothetical protein
MIMLAVVVVEPERQAEQLAARQQVRSAEQVEQVSLLLSQVRAFNMAVVVVDLGILQVERLELAVVVLAQLI